MTNRYERLKMQRRMQRRIRLVVEERLAARDTQSAVDPEATMEIPPRDLPLDLPAAMAVVPQRAIGRVAVPQA
ncbi:hypothetical protein AB0M02_02595 [Actinoplanes sp. NPDC051861]|uniref:hypothetical protein n=1 Tax=Actinoplanes sp. NPDC051861 TaxID=3155170 RepID=UPI00341D06C7